MWNSRSDVLVLVLVRLPPKSLGRCKSVSRSWKVLISSSEFVRSYLRYQSSIQNKVYRLLRVVGSHETHLAEYSIDGRADCWENLELGCEIQPLYNPYESHGREKTSMLVGSCNGLICQTLSHSRDTRQLSIYGEYEISLCNPLTKSTRVLPKSPLSDDLLRGRTTRVVFYGFGYDDVHDTYKVFVASGPPVDEYRYRSDSLPDAKYEYQVYNLRSDKWIMLSLDLDFHDYFFHCPIWKLDGVLVNCALHWILRNPYGPNHNKNKNYILAFDLRVDKLNILPLPEAADEYHQMLLIALNGCLLLCNHIAPFQPESIVDMWMMKDYGFNDSWTRIRILNSTYHLCFITPVALLEDNHRKKKLIYHDIRFCDSRGMITLCYDIESHQVVEFPTPPSAVSFHCPKQLQFVPSLVQPHPPSSGDPENVIQE